MGLFKTQEAKNTLWLGLLCSLAYLACYFARNLLGAVTPALEEQGVWSVTQIGYISTAYLVCYAGGQLINGMLGEKIKAVYMVSTGLIVAGLCNIAFAFIPNYFLSLVVYGLSGYGLSMIYAPMVKTVTENTPPHFASRCLLGFTFASFLGSPMAGLAASLFSWQISFVLCCVVALVMGVIIFACFKYFEKSGVIAYTKKQDNASSSSENTSLFRHQIVKWTCISALTGVVRTAVVFWATSFFSDYLGFGPAKGAVIYSVVTLINSFCPYFNNLIFYERIMKRRRDATVLCMFFMSMVFFLLLFFVKLRILAIILFLLALMTNSGASTMLWSVYLPSLKDTGHTSFAAGFLDCISYIAAAIASSLFANAVAGIGWQPLILVWAGLMFCGVLICLPFGKIFKHRKKDDIPE